MVGYGQGAAAPACGSLTFPGAPGDTETFENSAGNFCTQSFTEVDPDGLVNTYSSDYYYGGAHSVFFDISASPTGKDYIRADLGSSRSAFSISFWIRMPATPGGFMTVATLTNNTTNPTNFGDNSFNIIWQASNKIATYDYKGGSYTGGSTALTSGAWYRFDMSFTKNTASNLKIYNSSLTLVDTINVTPPNIDIRYFAIGGIDNYGTPANTRLFYVDDIIFNTTAP